MKFLSLIILFLSSLNLLQAQIIFNEASDDDAFELKEHLVSFYSQELLEAGLFSDAVSAFQAAKEEVLQEVVPLHFFHLTSDECQDTRLGYLAYFIDGETAYIEGIYLDQKSRGLGIGKQTLDQLESKLRCEGVKVVRLYVFAHNQPAFNLYKKSGYLIENSYPTGYQMQKEIIADECKFVRPLL